MRGALQAWHAAERTKAGLAAAPAAAAEPAIPAARRAAPDRGNAKRVGLGLLALGAVVGIALYFPSIEVLEHEVVESDSAGATPSVAVVANERSTIRERLVAAHNAVESTNFGFHCVEHGAAAATYCAVYPVDSVVSNKDVNNPERIRHAALADEHIRRAEIMLLIGNLTNAERLAAALEPFARFDGSLMPVAQLHAEDMARRGYFAHDTPEGATPTDRAVAAGYECTKQVGAYVYSGVGENIHMVGGPSVEAMSDSIATIAVRDLMASLPHRANILEERYDRMGIGLAFNAQGNEAYIVQNFC